MREELRKGLARSGAWLFLIGIVTGLWTAAVLTGKVHVARPRLALAAHLNGVIGGLWLVAVAWTFDFLGYDERRLRRLSFFVQLPAWANWAVTLVASGLGVSGLEYTRDPKNNVIAFLLQVLVVLPTLVGAAMWAWGFRSPRRP
jgi:hydroxylaminobenzene mutase